MDISQKTETELKALKCEAYESIAVNQQNISLINEELKKRANVSKEDLQTKLEEVKPA